MQNTKLTEQPFDYYCIIDFEATCIKEDGTPFENEIIEFPIILLNPVTLKIEDKFHTFVKPTINPKLSQFCTELTGIKQEQVDQGVVLEEALQLVHQWLQQHGLFEKKFAFATDGPWDLR
jgi:inhibitor of KinA sporulation pathway (predicted exonuclease)